MTKSKPPPATSTAAPEAVPEAVPGSGSGSSSDSGLGPSPDSSSSSAPASARFPLPKFRLEIRDLAHPGARRFLSDCNAADCLARAAQRVLALLYADPACPTTTAPPTRSVTVVLRDMPGVAYTTGSDLDPEQHKEIHFSLAYVAGIKPAHRGPHEIAGVLTHELVHCLQYNGLGSCPGGLIEGIADWVRLHCDLSPPHWHRDADGKWDAGYQHTAYFLDYLEQRFGHGTIQRMNEKLRVHSYEEKAFWTELVGRPVHQLWDDYSEHLRQTDAGTKA